MGSESRAKRIRRHLFYGVEARDTERDMWSQINFRRLEALKPTPKEIDRACRVLIKARRFQVMPLPKGQNVGDM